MKAKKYPKQKNRKNKIDKAETTTVIVRDKLPALGGRMVFLVLLTGFWFFSAVNPTRTNDFSPHDVIAIGLLTGAVVIIQLAAVAALTAVGAARRWVNLLFAIATAANFYYLLLLVDSNFAAWPTAVKIGFLALLSGGAWLLFSASSENRRWQIGVLVVGGILFAQAAATQAVYQLQIAAQIRGTAININIGDTTSATNVRAVEFVRRPNIYFISFDGMAPSALAKEFIQLDELRYETAVRQHEFRLFKNHFANGNVTRPALNQMLAVDTSYYYELQDEQARYSPFLNEYTLFSGLTPAPLWEIFKANGYATYSLAYDQFFGPQKGPHVDNYLIPAGFSACSSMSGAHVSRVFFHYCSFLSRAYARNWFNLRKYRVLIDPGKHRNTDVERLLAAVSQIADSKQPSVLLSYLAIPGHSEPPYHYHRPETHAAYYAEFADGDQQTAVAIDRIMRRIKRIDPEAIVYIFGDHGAFLTRGVEPSHLQNEEQKTFFVRDRYGAFGAIWPADVCRESFANRFSPNTITPAEVARHVIRCLADGQDPVIAPINYPVHYESYHHRNIKLADSFNDYQYE